MARSCNRLRYDELPSSDPLHIAQLCPAVSRSLIDHLAQLLPVAPALVLSIGCGTGLLEALLLDHLTSSASVKATPHLVGVEVEGCPAAAEHLPSTKRALVPTTGTVYDEAVLASALLFVYPRSPFLVAAYLDLCRGGALERLVWFSHRTDWPAYSAIVEAAFEQVNVIKVEGIAPYEMLIIGTAPTSSTNSS